MREQEPLISNYIDLLITKLGILALAGNEIDMSAWFNFLTFDVIGDLVFGESFECLESAELHVSSVFPLPIQPYPSPLLFQRITSNPTYLLTKRFGSGGSEQSSNGFLAPRS